ncbi:MAG: archaellin/type IV pilin N-terminal domain-containing protein [Dehalococcoidales bacterium]|jgi:flagellin FlaB
MFSKLSKLISRDEKGITGLETAIILIAFVVVAAVFAYTALSAGLFATQKSQEAVFAGLEEARSSLELKGAVTATANTTGSSGTIKQITFIVSGALSGEPIDFTEPTADSATGKAAATTYNKVIISYIDQYQQVDDLYWTATPMGKDDGDEMLESGEKFQIVIGSATAGSGAGNLIDALTTDLGPNKTFSIVVRPAVGAVLTIERTTPAVIDTIMDLH